MPDATLNASYHAYRFVPNRRPDKAFTPHPAVGAQCLMRRLTRLIRPTSLCRTVGRIRHVTNTAPEILTGSPRAPVTHQPTAQRLPAWRSPSFAPRHTRRGHETRSGVHRQFFDVLQIIHLARDYQQTQFRQLAALCQQTDAALNLLIIASG